MTPSAPDVNRPAGMPDGDPTDLRAAVAAAWRAAGLQASLRALYAEADAGLAGLDATCTACGACCDFARVPYRLYVSTAELALLTRVAPSAPAAPRRCPYQREALCTARDRRPLGCRAHFCEASARSAGQAGYERFHGAIRRLHERYRVAYHYVELTDGLADVLASAGENATRGRDPYGRCCPRHG
ncbi:MAG: YkgJ family cysteine cluster protein [Planctomycetota bacterium]